MGNARLQVRRSDHPGGTRDRSLRAHRPFGGAATGLPSRGGRSRGLRRDRGRSSGSVRAV